MKKYRMLGITSGIGSMMAPARFDDDLKEKIEIVGNQEWRKYYNCGIFETNFDPPYWPDWGDVPAEAKENIDIVMSHPECGNYSVLNNDITKRDNETDIGPFVEKVSEVRPKFFLMDDLYRSLGPYPSKWYAEKLPDYDLFFEPISNYHYGNIQKHRKRFFIVGALKELEFTFVPGEKHDHMESVMDLIGDLPAGDAPWLDHWHVKGSAEAKSWKPQKEGDDRLYITWDELAERFRDSPPGKNLKYINKKGEEKVRIGYVRLYGNAHSHVLYGGGAQGYPGAFHPVSGYPLTVRERARIQGFPDEFRFPIDQDLPAHEQLHIGTKATGKAMPLQFCRYVTHRFIDHLEGKVGSDDATGMRFYGNIPELITQEKEKYCAEFGYSNQAAACNRCWHEKCPIRHKVLYEDLLEF